jgi:hypothetical protein
MAIFGLPNRAVIQREQLFAGGVHDFHRHIYGVLDDTEPRILAGLQDDGMLPTQLQSW